MLWWKWTVGWRGRGALIVGFLACVASAKAEPQSIAILALASEDEEGLATSFTDALRSQATSDSAFHPSDSRASLSQMTMAQDCEISEAACRAQIAAALAVQKVLYGELRRSGRGAYEVELHMFSAAGGAQVSATRQLARGETSETDLARHARAMLRALRGAPEEPASSDEPASRATITPDVEPLHQAPIDASEPQKRRATPNNDWIGYTLLGVSGVSLGLMVFSWTKIASADGNESLGAYRKAVGAAKASVADVCDEADKGVRYGGLSSQVVAEARDACSRGNTFERLQYVFLGAALVAAGVGAYFLLDNKRGDRTARPGPNLALRPGLGRGTASLTLRLAL